MRSRVLGSVGVLLAVVLLICVLLVGVLLVCRLMVRQGLSRWEARVGVSRRVERCRALASGVVGLRGVGGRRVVRVAVRLAVLVLAVLIVVVLSAVRSRAVVLRRVTLGLVQQVAGSLAKVLKAALRFEVVELLASDVADFCGSLLIDRQAWRAAVPIDVDPSSDDCGGDTN